MSHPFALYIKHRDVIAMLEAELQAGLAQFWKTAAVILHDSSVHLVAPGASTFSLPRNFFSMLFLYSYYRVGIPADRRILYVAINQCLRGMVTGCDNLLDDEYKTTLETDLPPQAHRFRSVLDIMVADRVLFSVMQHFCADHACTSDLGLQASALSLKALTSSGVQEASEEGGIVGELDDRLSPNDILQKVHHYKTGLLFQSVWTIPALIEKKMTDEAKAAQDALYRIGIGCQMLDDIVDLFVDLREKRHNYVASAVVHEVDAMLREKMVAAMNVGQSPDQFYATCPAFFSRMKNEALTMLQEGLQQLFLDAHQELVRPATRFIADRIGVPVD